MAKKKRKKKKNRHEEEAAVMPIVAHEKALGIGATALATFARDLATFGSRSEEDERRPVR